MSDIELPLSAHDDILIGDIRTSVYLNYEWRRLINHALASFFDRFTYDIGNDEIWSFYQQYVDLILDVNDNELPVMLFQSEFSRHVSYTTYNLTPSVAQAISFQAYTGSDPYEVLRGADWLPTGGNSFLCPASNYYRFHCILNLSQGSTTGFKHAYIINTTTQKYIATDLISNQIFGRRLTLSGEAQVNAGERVALVVMTDQSGVVAGATNPPTILAISKVGYDIN